MADIENGPTGTPAVKNVSKVAAQVAEQVSATVKKATEAANTGMKDAQAQVTDGLKQATEMARVYAGVQRSALETATKSGQIFGEGLKALATQAANANRVQFEDTVAHFRALTGVKSIKQALAMQAEFARATTSRMLTETTTLVEDFMKVTSQTLAPVTALAREAAEQVKQAA